MPSYEQPKITDLRATGFNPIRPAVSYLICRFITALNDQHDQNSAEKPTTSTSVF